MQSKIELLSKILGKCISTGEEYLFFCPKCKHHKPKLSLNFSKNVYKCWICNLYGRGIRNLVKRYGNYIHLSTWDEIIGYVDLSNSDDILSLLQEPIIEESNIEYINLPKEYRCLLNDHSLLSNQSRVYLKERDISKEDILKWKIGYCCDGEFGGRIIIPSFAENGKINYFIARSYDNNYIKYKNPKISNKDIVFNHLFVNFKDPVVLVEGVFDAIKAGENSIPILGNNLREDFKLFFEIVKNNSVVYLALDPDAKKQEFRIMDVLLKYGIIVYKVEIEPYKDVGEMTKKEFQDRKNDAIPMSNDMLLLYKIKKGI